MLDQCPVCEWQPLKDHLCPNCHSDLTPLLRALEEERDAGERERARAASTRRLIVALPAVAFLAGLGIMALVRPAPPPVQTAPPPAAAQVAAPAPAPSAPQPRAAQYIVRRGDSLWIIARRAYGQAALWPKILEANPGLAAQALKAGEQIRLFPVTIEPQGATSATSAPHGVK